MCSLWLPLLPENTPGNSGDKLNGQHLQYWGQPRSIGDNPVPPGQAYAAPLRKTVAQFLSLVQTVTGLAGQKVISFPMAIKEAL